MGTEAPALDLLLAVPKAIKPTLKAIMKMFPLSVPFHPPPPFFFAHCPPLLSSSRSPRNKRTFDSYHRLLLLQPEATASLGSPLATRGAVDLFSWLTETSNFQTKQNEIKC